MTDATVTEGTTVITIYSIEITGDVQKQPIMNFPLLKKSSAWSAGPERFIVETLNVEQTVTLTGYLDVDSKSGSTTVWDALDTLVGMIITPSSTEGGSKTLTIYDGTTTRLLWRYEAFPTKLNYKIVPDDNDVAELIAVTISFLKATDKSKRT